MGLSCGGKFLKFLVIFFNTIVFIGGGVIACWGIYLIVEAKKTAGSVSVTLPACITAFGLLLFVIGFFGVFGACYNNACMLKTFAAIVGILLICEVVCGILILVYRHNFVNWAGDELRKKIQKLVAANATLDDPTMKDIVDLQKDLECCGGKGPSDWGTSYPPSCCGEKAVTCSNPYKVGCARAMYNKIKKNALAFGITVLVVCLIQIGAIICAACLASKVNEYEKV